MNNISFSPFSIMAFPISGNLNTGSDVPLINFTRITSDFVSASQMDVGSINVKYTTIESGSSADLIFKVASPENYQSTSSQVLKISATGSSNSPRIGIGDFGKDSIESQLHIKGDTRIDSGKLTLAANGEDDVEFTKANLKDILEGKPANVTGTQKSGGLTRAFSANALTNLADENTRIITNTSNAISIDVSGSKFLNLTNSSTGLNLAKNNTGTGNITGSLIISGSWPTSASLAASFLPDDEIYIDGELWSALSVCGHIQVNCNANVYSSTNDFYDADVIGSNILPLEPLDSVRNSLIMGENNKIFSSYNSLIAGSGNKTYYGGATPQNNIIAGANNEVSSSACIVGGQNNTVGGLANNAIVGGYLNTVEGFVGVAFGSENKVAYGLAYSLVHGQYNIVSGSHAHAEGFTTIASGTYSHTEGANTRAYGNASHAEGEHTLATGNRSHAEGFYTTASGNHSHAQGNNTLALGAFSHAEGRGVTASGAGSHAEGVQTKVYRIYAHAEGYKTLITSSGQADGSPNPDGSGDYAHAEGAYTTSSGDYAHSEGALTLASGLAAHAEGSGSIASNGFAHAEGEGARAAGTGSHAEGYYTWVTGKGEHAHAEGYFTTASNRGSHAEGRHTVAFGQYSHAEGSGSEANGTVSHAEGFKTKAEAFAAHAEGRETSASGDYSHAEGYKTLALGDYSHTLGNETTASGQYSLAHGLSTDITSSGLTAEGDYSVVLGSQDVIARGEYSSVISSRYSTSSGYLSTIISANPPRLDQMDNSAPQPRITHNTASVIIASERGQILGSPTHVSAYNLAQGSGYISGSSVSRAVALNTSAVLNTDNAFAANGGIVVSDDLSVDNNGISAHGGFAINSGIVSGSYSFAAGQSTIAAGTGSAAFGRYNIKDTNSGSLLIIGNGNIDNRRNLAAFNSQSIILDTAALPTSDPNNEGQLWRDGTTLKISLG
jgi:hypothetical protein